MRSPGQDSEGKHDRRVVEEVLWEYAPYPYQSLDSDCRILTVNEAWESALGYDRGAAVGQSFDEFLTPDSTDAFADHCETIRTDGQVSATVDIVRADGTEMTVKLDGKAEYDGDQHVRTHCQFYEISDQVGGEHGLATAEPDHRSMAAALNTAEVGTFILDSDFSVVWINEAIEEFFGISREAVVGADKAEKIRAAIKHIFERPERFADTVIAGYEDNTYVESFECHVLPDDGREERWLLHWSTPIESGQYAGGRVEHYTDITERVDSKERIEAQRDNLELINNVVRHDIRNALQSILIHAQLLEEHVDDAGQGKLETVCQSAENASDLTETARDVAKVTLQSDIDRRSVLLGPTLEREVSEARNSHPAATVTLDDAPSVTVHANEMLGSVFRNLLKNAVQHNDTDRPEVAVSTDVTDETVEVSVADNGPGIPEGQRADIFEKGEKGLESGGSGLGLYLVGTLVDGYGGDVRVADRKDDDGTVFTVVLPRA
jgi:PAS domain S-box-containing protein